MKEILYLCSVFIKLVYRMDAKKILFIAQEITPYLPESEIATTVSYTHLTLPTKRIV